MGQIYETASTIAIYLGQSTERSERGMQALRSFTEPTTTSGDPPWLSAAVLEIEQGLEDILTRP